MIAALFVETHGVYYGLDDIDPWNKARDARKYNGPWPVIAHPPCQLWTNFAFLNYKRWGGEHNRPGNDGGCFESALTSVQTYGGVLEHPAGSHAWEKHWLEKPRFGKWSKSGNGFVTEVWQSAYGHKARKRTWLYYVGWKEPLPMEWTKLPGHYQCGEGFNTNKPVLSKHQANATPVRFRDALIDLVRHGSER